MQKLGKPVPEYVAKHELGRAHSKEFVFQVRNLKYIDKKRHIFKFYFYSKFYQHVFSKVGFNSFGYLIKSILAALHNLAVNKLFNH